MTEERNRIKILTPEPCNVMNSIQEGVVHQRLVGRGNFP